LTALSGLYIPGVSIDESDRREALLVELGERIGGHARADETTRIDGFRVCAADRPSEPHASRSGTVLAVVMQGSKRLAIGERVYDYGPGQYLIASVDLPVIGHTTHATVDEPALGLGMTLQPSAIASLLLEAPANLATPPDRPPPPGIGVADASADLLDALLRMVRLLDNPDDRPILAASIEREILWRLLRGPLGATARQIGRSDSTLTHIGRAVRWITEHYSTPFRVEALARSCGMSPSAFHRNFHAVTALSPIQFQKQIRLQRSRLLLMSGANDVGTIGHQVGYDSTSQFSREYRRQFGLPPGRDAAKLRAAADVTG
jgi:AraC-like DNA-binding protein